MCSHGFSPGALVSPPSKTCMLGVSPVSTLDQGIASESGVDIWALHCGCPLLLRDKLIAENTFHCTLNMLPIKYLYPVSSLLGGADKMDSL